MLSWSVKYHVKTYSLISVVYNVTELLAGATQSVLKILLTSEEIRQHTDSLSISHNQTGSNKLDYNKLNNY